MPDKPIADLFDRVANQGDVILFAAISFELEQALVPVRFGLGHRQLVVDALRLLGVKPEAYQKNPPECGKCLTRQWPGTSPASLAFGLMTLSYVE